MHEGYSAEDAALLSSIRRHVLSHIEFYQPGADWLYSHFGPARLHAEASADWERFKDHPTQIASHREAAQHAASMISDPAQREPRYREVLEQLLAAPKIERWTAGACACRAIQELLHTKGSTHNDVRAKATLLMAVMLWDEDAHGRHQILAGFGEWGVDPGGRVETVERWAATYFIDGNRLDDWMELVKTAWSSLVKPEDSAPPPDSRSAPKLPFQPLPSIVPFGACRHLLPTMGRDLPYTTPVSPASQPLLVDVMGRTAERVEPSPPQLRFDRDDAPRTLADLSARLTELDHAAKTAGLAPQHQEVRTEAGVLIRGARDAGALDAPEFNDLRGRLRIMKSGSTTFWRILCGWLEGQGVLDAKWESDGNLLLRVADELQRLLPAPEPLKPRRGRRPDTDPHADRRVFDAWKSGQYRTYEELATRLGKPKREVKLAIDRHEKRLARGTK